MGTKNLLKGNSANLPNSQTLKAKSGYLEFASSGDLSRASGRELGHQASKARAKTAESMLEFCSLVYAAYSRFYEPWNVVGRKPVKRGAEAREAEANWKEFLVEMGWEDFPRYQKLIRETAAIGRRAQVLQSHSSDLPASVSALSTLCKLAKSDKQLETYAGKCSPEFTAVEVKQLFSPKDMEDAQSTKSVSVLKCDLVLEPDSMEANAAVIAVLFALEMNEESLGRGTTLEGLATLDSQLATVVRTYLASSEIKTLVALYDDRLSKSEEMKKRLKKKKREFSELKKTIKAQRAETPLRKTRDFSKIKV
jgi:hypothetical protein